MSAHKLKPGFSIGFWIPAIDLYEMPSGYAVYIELPGVQPQDVEILIEQNSIVVKGRKLSPVKGLSAMSMEIETGFFRRAVDLSCSIDKETAKAEFENGLLKIILQKISGSKKVVVPIEE